MKYCALAFCGSIILCKATILCPVLQDCILVPFGYQRILNVDLKPEHKYRQEFSESVHLGAESVCLSLIFHGDSMHQNHLTT